MLPQSCSGWRNPGTTSNSGVSPAKTPLRDLVPTVCSLLQTLTRTFAARLFSIHLIFNITMRILLIEDNPVLREMYLLVLVPDYKVTTATTAAEAKLMLGRHQFDAVVSDFTLPDGTSAEVFEQFPCPAQNVLMMTGEPNNVQFQQLISRFHLPFLAKPFSPFLLKQKLEEMVVH